MRLIACLACVLATGCASITDLGNSAYEFIPRSPVTVSSGNLVILKTVFVKVDAGIKSPLQDMPDQPPVVVVTQQVVVVAEPIPNAPLPEALRYDFYAPENWRDDDGEEIWQAGTHGFDSIRLSGNDVDALRRNGIPAEGQWFSLDSASVPGISIRDTPDVVIVTVPEVIRSSKSGIKWYFCGVTIAKSANPLVRPTQGSIRIPKDQCRETLRLLFASVR